MTTTSGRIAAVIGYLLVTYFLVIFVVVPLALFGLAIGAVAGFLIALVCASRVLVTRYEPGRVDTPAAVAARPLRRRRQHRFVRRDRAWASYVIRQAWLDLVDAQRLTYQVVSRCWSAPVGWVRRGFETLVEDREEFESEWHILWFAPVLFPAAVALGGVTVGATLFVGLNSIAVGAFVIVLRGAGGILVYGLRAADFCWQVIYHAEASCPVCYAVTYVPAYLCPGHGAADRQSDERFDLHRDLRPGSLGVLWRRCSCGTHLPAMVQRAATTLQPFCPTCQARLHPRAGAATDVRIPVFGAASAGKTHLVMAGMTALLQVAGARQIPIDIVDERNREQFERFRAVVAGRERVIKTEASPPVATTVMLGIARGDRVRQRAMRRAGRGVGTLVHVYDAAGETYMDPTRNERYWFLDYARTLIFVVDPFSIPEIRDTYGEAFRSLFAQANAALGGPEESYHATVTRLRLGGVRMTRKRLAVVVSKADLIRQLPSESGLRPESTDVRAWLCDRGLDNIVTAAERDFGQVRFFLTSALTVSLDQLEENLRPDSALAPFAWLFEGERLALRGEL